MNRFDVIKKPIDTEKLNRLRDRENKYGFEVALQASKTEVKQAVESLFKVKVVDVKTSIVRGKMRRIGRSQGMRPNWKKAIVTLKEGDAISKRNADKALFILDNWSPSKPSTEAAVEAFEKLGLEDALVIDSKNENLFKSIRNARKFDFLPVEGANVYDILRHRALILTQAGAKALEGALA